MFSLETAFILLVLAAVATGVARVLRHKRVSWALCFATVGWFYAAPLICSVDGGLRFAIHPGMTAGEVRAILGEPMCTSFGGFDEVWHYPPRQRHWIGLFAPFYIAFDADGRVVVTWH